MGTDTSYTEKPNCNPPRRPYLRRYFFVRRHYGWGAAVCWYQWLPLAGKWGINWGIGCKTMGKAKTIRKFLNGRVQRFSGYGVPFEEVVRVVLAGNSLPDQPRIMC